MKRRTKLVVSVLWDLVDFLARVPILGTMFDVVGTVLAIWMYGGKGALAGVEVLDVTDQFDGFLPSLTILWFLEGKK